MNPNHVVFAFKCDGQPDKLVYTGMEPAEALALCDAMAAHQRNFGVDFFPPAELQEVLGAEWQTKLGGLYDKTDDRKVAGGGLRIHSEMLRDLEKVAWRAQQHHLLVNMEVNEGTPYFLSNPHERRPVISVPPVAAAPRLVPAASAITLPAGIARGLHSQRKAYQHTPALKGETPPEGFYMFLPETVASRVHVDRWRERLGHANFEGKTVNGVEVVLVNSEWLDAQKDQTTGQDTTSPGTTSHHRRGQR